MFWLDIPPVLGLIVPPDSSQSRWALGEHHTTAHSEATNTARGTRNVRSALVMLALIAGFFLLREHWSHIAGYWPYLLLLACPLMHLFHGHGGQGLHGSGSSDK